LAIVSASLVPGIAFSRAWISPAMRASSALSGPKTLIARSPRARGQHFGNAHFDGLGIAGLDAGQIGQGRRIWSTSHTLSPLRHSLRGLSAETVGLVEAHRVEAQFVRARARDHLGHLGHLGQDRALHLGHPPGCGPARSRRLGQLHDDAALIHGGQEGLARHRIGHRR
jgi:hypothetical protein